MWGVRNCVGDRPFAREGGVVFVLGWRWARRYGCGESLANVSRGNDRVDCVVESDMLGREGICGKALVNDAVHRVELLRNYLSRTLESLRSDDAEA